MSFTQPLIPLIPEFDPAGIPPAAGRGPRPRSDRGHRGHQGGGGRGGGRRAVVVEGAVVKAGGAGRFSGMKSGLEFNL